MHQRLATLFIAALFLALQSCDSANKQIVGKWRVDGAAADAIWEFQTNGTVVTSSGTSGRYTLGGTDRLKIQTPSATFVHQLDLQGDRMTWREQSGVVTQLTRVK